ncbi:CWC16 protein [Phascolomyces articulosus]|uniref:Splicing factor YJU2 n=1 Tax=Phascolomyces articulosus TaxID=60185 RepID=A0AAD5KRC3_9FUNG|nr:CWC16 protein [Phascolomyces articulosus]
MSERKVLNKYFPPNFDPSQIPRQKKPKDQQHKVRLMAPFSMRCESCGEYIYKGKKFNARKETVEGEIYLNIKIFRFYIRCPRCSAEITFKTDPKNTDYVAEHGASRNFEPWRGEDEIKPEGEEEEDVDDPMKALENRTLDSKREMEILDALDEIRLRNAKSERVNVDDVLERFTLVEKGVIEERLNQETLEDEKQAAEVFQSGDGERVRKLAEGDEPDVFSLLSQQRAAAAPTTTTSASTFKSPSSIPKQQQNNAAKRKAEQQSFGIAVKRKTESDKSKPTAKTTAKTTITTGTTKTNNTQKPANSGLSMLASYDDDSSSDESSL